MKSIERVTIEMQISLINPEYFLNPFPGNKDSYFLPPNNTITVIL